MSFLSLCYLPFLGLLSIPAVSKDDQQPHSRPHGGGTRNTNASGDIEVTGYIGSSVNVVACREGGDEQLVQIEDSSTAGEAFLRVRYPQDGNCDASVQLVFPSAAEAATRHSNCLEAARFQPLASEQTS